MVVVVVLALVFELIVSFRFPVDAASHHNTHHDRLAVKPAKKYSMIIGFIDLSHSCTPRLAALLLLQLFRRHRVASALQDALLSNKRDVNCTSAAQ